jgi:hypothetical protein
MLTTKIILRNIFIMPATKTILRNILNMPAT